MLSMGDSSTVPRCRVRVRLSDYFVHGAPMRAHRFLERARHFAVILSVGSHRQQMMLKIGDPAVRNLKVQVS